MEKHVWGQTPDGEDVVVYELTGTNGMRASVMNYGANLLTLFVPDKNSLLNVHSQGHCTWL